MIFECIGTPPRQAYGIFIAKKIKGRSSRILRQEFPHLRDWCDEHLWAPGCYHGSVGQGWEVVEKYISTQNYRTVLKVRKL
ncbi:MAG: transposase, partial [Euryarchaeota archaeon]|nr:transposase [Euryarchaeota archaeon]